jgi:cytochrome P450
VSTISLAGYDPMDPATQQDPYGHYQLLRCEAPVYKGPQGITFVSRHDGVSEVLGQPRMFSSQWGNTAGAPPIPGAEKELAAIFADAYPAVNTMLTLDPPLQTRYRKSIGRAFSTRRVASLEPQIRELTRALLDEWPADGTVDFMRQMSIPLPVRVITQALGIPLEHQSDVKRWSDDSVSSIGVKVTKERGLEAARGIVQMQHFLASLLEDRQREPQGDFLSELVAADFEDAESNVRKLEIPEMISMVQQLLVAGNEATTKGINEIVKLLIQNPDVWKQICEEPSLIPAMVEEGLRLASPNQGLFRICTEDSSVTDTPIPKGSMLWVMFGSANRDERVFPEPDRFDPTRANLNDSLAFGRGAHFCIGAQLARLELNVLFEELAREILTMRFAAGSTLEYEPSFILRGLKELRIDVVRS